MKNMSRVFSLVFGLTSVAAAKPGRTLAERLGYGPTDKIVILHADDIGSFPSANTAILDLMKQGSVRSGSVMMPAFASRNLDAFKAINADLGVHVSLNAEFGPLRWEPLLAGEVPSLVGKDGSFLASPLKLAIQGKAPDIEREMEAQIRAAIAAGLNPTHIDTHFGSVFFHPAWLQSYLRLARKYKLVPFLPRFSNQWAEKMWGRAAAKALPFITSKVEAAGYLLLDDFYLLPQPKKDLGYAARKEAYLQIFRGLKPGVTEVILHPAYADATLERDVLRENPGQRLRDHEAKLMQDPDVLRTLRAQNIHLIGWREVQAVYPWDELQDIDWFHSR